LIYIIGSGLSGIAAAIALVKRGFRPTILDAGVRADPGILDLKARMASVEPDAWIDEDLSHLKRTGPAARSGIPRKLHFGSNFAYRDIDRETSAHFRNASILRSFAQGGFSNVWGAVIQPLPQKEFQRWPIGFQQLARHYSAVKEYLCPSESPVRPSAQGHEFHDDLARHRPELEREGIHFHTADLAVRSSDDETGKGCRHCGLCLYGCPYDSIFTAASQLSRMILKGEVSYVPDVLVDRISPVNRGIRIEGRGSNDSTPRSFDGSAVFLAAGLLESARIVLNSTSVPAVPLRVQQSDIFTIPMLRYRSTPNIARERIHTLCQTIVEIDDDAISSHGVQLQLYGYNDLYLQILARRAGVLAGPLKPLLQAVSTRLVVAFGYFHSDVSSSVRITRRESGNGRLHLEGQVNEETRRAGRAVVRKLFQIRNYSRAVPIPMQARFDEPGGGHRSGGCFPMRSVPIGLETDLWGRVTGMPGMHVVDASVLPSVPAGPVAYTMMANAHRIASECPIYPNS
jgi:choline dehydrogenase-like flavoprotein